MGKVPKWEEEEFRIESLTQKNNLAAIRQKLHKNRYQTLRAKYSDTEFFWSVFSCIWVKYGGFTEQISILGRNTGKYEPEKTPYLDTFHAVRGILSGLFSLIFSHCFVNFVVDCRLYSWRIFFRGIDGVAYT